MSKRSNIWYGLFILISGSSFVWWQAYDPTHEITLSEPGKDGRISSDSVTEVVKIGEMYTRFSETEPAGTETWPRFRGADFDNISKSKTPLIDRFHESGPPLMWKHELGEGHAGAAIYDGKVYLLDYDETRRADLLRCYDLVTGEPIWERGYRVSVKRNHGMSRTVPAVTDKYILTVGPRGHVMCLDRADGQFRWGIDLIAEYGSELPLWYTAQCPLIDNDLAILAPGGSSLMIGVDCESGEVVWNAPNPGNWQMSHASIMPWTYKGTKMYVYSAVGGVAAVGATGDHAGQVLWKTDAWNHSVVAPSAFCMPDGKVFLTAGYGAGSMMLQISGQAPDYQVTVLYTYRPAEGLASEQQTPVMFGGKLFGILPKDAGALRNQFICVDPSDTRQVLWSSGKETRFGLGPYMIADNKFFILSDEGELTMARLSTTGWELLDRYQVLDGHDAWAPLAVADGYMVLRDSKDLICLDLRKE